MVGRTHRVLVESISKKSAEKMMGRNSQNAVVVFPKYKNQDVRVKNQETDGERETFKKGEYVDVFVDKCTSTTLIGKVIQ